MDRPTSLDEWVALLQERPLPLMQNSRDNLLQLDFDNISIARLSNIALTDPGLTLTILRAAGQRPSKRLQGEILTLDVAAMNLGMSALAKLIEGMQTLETTVDKETKELYMKVVNRTYHGAYQAYGMARIRVDIVPEEIFTAAMLQEIGTLMLLVHGNHTLNSEIISSEAQQITTLGFTLKQLSQQLTRQWNLSNFIQRSLLDEVPTNNARLYEIHLASTVAHAAEQSWESEEMLQLMEAIAHHLHIDMKDVLEEVRDNAILSGEETVFYGVTPAAARLPGLTDEQRSRLNITDTAATSASGGPVTPPPPINTSVKPKTPPATIATITDSKSGRDDAALAIAIQQLEQMLTEPIQLPKLMALLKQAFHEALGLNQSFFAMLSQDRKHLVSRFVFGSEQGFRNLRIPVIHGNLFERLLEKPQALWVKDDNRQKVIPLLPSEFQKLIKVEHFFTMTIRVKGKPLGIVYGDRYAGYQPLDEIDYEKFRQICLLLTKGFEQLGR